MDAAYTFLPVGDGEWAGGMLVQPDCYGEDAAELQVTVSRRAGNEPSRSVKFHNHGEKALSTRG